MQYFDWKWEPSSVSTARFLSIVEPSDSLWLKNDYYIRERRLQMKGFFNDSACRIKHGYFIYYHSNGQVASRGLYNYNKKEGLWLFYHSNGQVKDSIVYDKGRPFGIEIRRYPNGKVSDSIFYNNDGQVFIMSWFDNGHLSATGYSFHNKQEGQWQYYHRNGNLSAAEEYDTGRLKSRVYYDEKGIVMQDTSSRDRLAVCEEDFIKYLSKHPSMPLDRELIHGDKAVVVVDFVIDEAGKVVDISIYNSLHPSIDKMVIKAIRRSPKWLPAIDHNRYVKAYRRQPITILQDTY